jgi:AraC-like DNA-binding protein
MLKNIEIKQKSMMVEFSSLSDNNNLLAKVIECFPYPIEAYTPDGTSVMVNKAMLAEYHTVNPDAVVGKYNIFKDPAIIASGQIGVLRRAFQGETVFFTDVKVPIEEIVERYGIQDFDIEAVFQDITVFPIMNDVKQVTYVVAMLVNRRVYRGKHEIEKAKEYIESHWFSKYNSVEAAKAACLSREHFVKLFKKHTGVTPYKYYVNYKVGKLKETLEDSSLSVAQAFAACGMDYNGNSARVFKDITGIPPSKYRKRQVN